MSDLFDYLNWRGDISFDEVGPNKIDYLLLSHLSYTIFDDVISENFNEAKTFTQLTKEFKLLPDYVQRCNIGFLINKRSTELMFKCAKTKRFKNVKLCGYKKIINEKNEEQFAAITYIINDKIVIAFQGTDDTFIGWKEDFNISFLPQIPAQKDALEYFSNVTENFNNPIIIAGHSKGGNLAINTAVKCSQTQQNQIEGVYNFDGPGFSKDFFESEGYLRIEDRINSYYPQFSVVGMIFNHPTKYQIVRSNGFAFMQHDEMSWQILGKDFITEKDFTDESKFFYKAFNEWAERLTIKQKEKFVNALFEIILSSGAKTITDIQKNAIPSTAKMIAAFSNMDKSTKKEVRTVLHTFKDVIRSDFPLFKFFNLIDNNNL